MTWHEAQLSLQVIAERTVGAPQRAMVRQVKDREDAAAQAVIGAIGGRG